MDQGADELQLLFHATGKLARLTLQERTHTAEIEQFFDAMPSTGKGDTVQVGIKVDIFSDGKIGVKGEALTHVGKFFLCPGGFGIDGKTTDSTSAATRRHDRCQQTQGGRFAGPIRPDQAEYLSREDLETEGINGDQRAEAFAQLIGLDCRHAAVNF
ncbi:hypothetical protein SAMN02745124_03383 [Desulfofustis glycolicus DSM 9705]|uniref:Uncharacterized protein n=1 Tax=Desulfofustis glycolicus DSM 9705 TaxID=1121409 RepID=A0A1M5XVS9_9BACT|nr:hypothetical protein SAMN02745124_03383 [Desulfofustis glycolicus DSM 9705]